MNVIFSLIGFWGRLRTTFTINSLHQMLWAVIIKSNDEWFNYTKHARPPLDYIRGRMRFSIFSGKGDILGRSLGKISRESAGKGHFWGVRVFRGFRWWGPSIGAPDSMGVGGGGTMPYTEYAESFVCICFTIRLKSIWLKSCIGCCNSVKLVIFKSLIWDLLRSKSTTCICCVANGGGGGGVAAEDNCPKGQKYFCLLKNKKQKNAFL